jgi:hypothetical protein
VRSPSVVFRPSDDSTNFALSHAQLFITILNIFKLVIDKAKPQNTSMGQKH